MLAELCLALAVYHEARGEPLIGQKAVAEVVMNRVASDRFPDTICGVVMQPKQFSFVSTNGWAGIPTDPDVWADAVNISQDAIGNHLNGQSYFANKAMLYYHSTEVSLVWTKSLFELFTLGNHTFYSDPLTKTNKPRERPVGDTAREDDGVGKG